MRAVTSHLVPKDIAKIISSKRAGVIAFFCFLINAKCLGLCRLTVDGCVKGSETSLRSGDLIEGTTKLRKVMLKVMVYCRERIQIKISQGKRYIR